MSKRGIANKVTFRRYDAIKRYIEKYDCGAVDDKEVGDTFGVSATVMRRIRNTRNYDEYLEQSKRYQRNRKAQKQLNGLLIDQPIDQPIVLPNYCSTNTSCRCDANSSLILAVIATANVVIAISLTYMAIHGL